MYILVVTRITLSSGISHECRLKVDVSTDGVTLGDIGRYLWPHVFTVVTCSSVQLYDSDLEDYVDVLNPEELIVNDIDQPKIKIRLDFVQSQAISVIREPRSYKVCGTFEGNAFVVSQSADEGKQKEATLLTKIRKKPVDVPRFDYGKVKTEVPELHEDPVLPRDASPASRPKKKPRLLSPVLQEQPEQVERSLALPAKISSSRTRCDQNSEIDGAADQVQQPESRKRRHSHRSVSPAPEIPPVQSKRNPLLDLVATVESDRVPEKASKKVVQFKKEVHASPEKEGEPVTVVQNYEQYQYQELPSPEQQPESETEHQSPKSNESAELPNPSEGRNYECLRSPDVNCVLHAHACAIGMNSKDLLNRLRRCNANPDADLIKILSSAMSDWLNQRTPGHSLNFRRAFIRGFFAQPFSAHYYDITVFTNMKLSGTVDKLLGPSSPLRDQPAKRPLILSSFGSKTKYKAEAVRRLKTGELNADEFFQHFQYALVHLSFLENEFQRASGISFSSTDFIDKWKTTWLSQIAKCFDLMNVPLSDDLYPHETLDRNSLMPFIKLFALTKEPTNPIELIRDLVVVTKPSDEETIHWIRTERAIPHPVILADKNGYRLFVGNRSVFQNTQCFALSVFQLIMVYKVLVVFPGRIFGPLLRVLCRLIGIHAPQSPRGDTVFRALRDGVLPKFK